MNGVRITRGQAQVAALLDAATAPCTYEFVIRRAHANADGTTDDELLLNLEVEDSVRGRTGGHHASGFEGLPMDMRLNPAAAAAQRTSETRFVADDGLEGTEGSKEEAAR